MTLSTFLEYNGAALGILGSLLVVSQSAKTRAIAFAVWISSNLSLMTLFILTGQYGLWGMQAVFLFASMAGLVNNLRTLSKPPADVEDLLAALAKEREMSKHKSWVISELEDLNQWRVGSAPGSTWVLVKTKHKIKVAKLQNNPCDWFDDHDQLIPDVTAWRPLL